MIGPTRGPANLDVLLRSIYLVIFVFCYELCDPLSLFTLWDVVVGVLCLQDSGGDHGRPQEMGL